MQIRPGSQKQSQSNSGQHMSTFYSPSPHELNMDSTHKLISSSKKLIREIQDRKQNLNGSKQLISSNKKISTKQKIEGTLKSMKHTTTIAQQLLLNQTPGTAKLGEYLGVIENMFGKTNKRRRQSQGETQWKEDENQKKGKSSHQLLSSQLQKQLVRKVSLAGKQESQTSFLEDPNVKYSNNRINVQQQLQQFDEMLKGKLKKTRTKLQPPELLNTNRVSIKLGSKKEHEISDSSSQSESLIYLSSSSSLQQKKTRNMSRLQIEIAKDPKNLKGSKKYIQERFNKNGTSGYSNQNNSGDFNQNGKFDIRLDSQYGKKNAGAYSFRERDAEQNQAFLVPKQQFNQANTIDQLQNDQAQNNFYYNDYGTGLSQIRIKKLLEVIEKRVKYSSAVIEPVMYQHQREDNNQLQIESRYDKETKDRSMIVTMISSYASNKSSQYASSTIKIDQFGNKVFTDQKRWKSPGAKCLRQIFNSLESPILSPKCCSRPLQHPKFFVSHHRNLLLERAGSTLTHLASNQKGMKKLRQKKVASRVASDTSSPENSEQESGLQSKLERCLIEHQWQSVKRLKKDVQIAN